MKPRKPISSRKYSFQWQRLREGRTPYFIGALVVFILLAIYLPKVVKRHRTPAITDQSSMSWRLKNDRELRKSRLMFPKKKKRTRTSLMPLIRKKEK